MFTKITAILTLTVFCFTQAIFAAPPQNLRKETTAEAGGKNELVLTLASAAAAGNFEPKLYSIDTGKFYDWGQLHARL